MEKIDVHVHCVPPSYREYCLKNDYAGRGHPDGMPAIPEWDPKTHIDLMDRLNITKSILSISSPGTNLTPENAEEARTLTRQVNTDMAKICADHPQRFMFFASLPLPDVEGALAEIDYALDHLGAIGFQILTNSHGIYPGDPRFNPVFDKLSERRAIVFFHPTSCRVQGHTETPVLVQPQPGVPLPILEFMFDSSRALMSLLTSHTLHRCPGITVIACHCGGTFPPLLQRIIEASTFLLGKERQLTREEVHEILRTRFYFDMAGAPFPDQIHGLLRMVDSSRLLYGSDYPYTPIPLVEKLAERMNAGFAEEIGTDIRKEVFSQNAAKLLERVQK